MADSILPGPPAQVWAGVAVDKTGLRLRPGLRIRHKSWRGRPDSLSPPMCYSAKHLHS